MVDFLAHGVELAAAAAGGEDEIVEFRSHFPHIEDHDVTPSIVSRGLGSGQGQLQSPIGSLGCFHVPADAGCRHVFVSPEMYCVLPASHSTL